MENLFEDQGACFSPCRKYRYALYRIWDLQKPYIMFIGLNPSTANETNDDPTIRRVIRFAREWGYGGIWMTNLFAWVSAYPEDLLTCEDPLGRNNEMLLKVRKTCDDVLFAWGNFKQAKQRAEEVIKMFPDAKALIINKDGSPRHPLYVPASTIPVNFN